MKKLLNLSLVAVMLLMLVPLSAGAQATATCQEEVVVQKADSLSKYAEKYLGNLASWPAVMALHNQAAQADPTKFPNKIINADNLEVGWKICIPTAADAEAFLKTYDPAKPEMLYAAGKSGKMVIGSWWTAGGEAEGLAGMFKIYKQKYPDVEIVNATVAGGAGTNFKAVLKTRLLGGDPPDTFQLHAGLEVQGYSPEEYLQPLDDIYASEGLEKAFPADLIALLKSYGGHYWGVPVNIHRSNVLWYNKDIFEKNNLKPPTTWDEFFAVCEALKAKGITPYGAGTKDGWEAAHVFEGVLVANLGADGYKGLWTGKTSWEDPKVTASLETFKKMMTYVNKDNPALSWDGGAGLIAEGKAAMFIMGDWADGYFTSKSFKGYGWVPTPGTTGVFVALSDSFAMTKKAPNPDNAKNWLKVCGSKEGQEAFNPQKGSICARTDCDPKLFNEYLQSAMVDWGKNAIVPSVTHGAAAYESWATEYKDIIQLFVTSGDVAGTQKSLQKACVTAAICK